MRNFLFSRLDININMQEYNYNTDNTIMRKCENNLPVENKIDDGTVNSLFNKNHAIM